MLGCMTYMYVGGSCFNQCFMQKVHVGKLQVVVVVGVGVELMLEISTGYDFGGLLTNDRDHTHNIYLAVRATILLPNI